VVGKGEEGPVGVVDMGGESCWVEGGGADGAGHERGVVGERTLEGFVVEHAQKERIVFWCFYILIFEGC
jgi:hypothetical protein